MSQQVHPGPPETPHYNGWRTVALGLLIGIFSVLLIPPMLDFIFALMFCILLFGACVVVESIMESIGEYWTKDAHILRIWGVVGFFTPLAITFTLINY